MFWSYTSVRNYQSTLHEIPKEHRSPLHCNESLKTCMKCLSHIAHIELTLYNQRLHPRKHGTSCSKRRRLLCSFEPRRKTFVAKVPFIIIRGNISVMKNYYTRFRKETRKYNTHVFYNTMDGEKMKCPNT